MKIIDQALCAVLAAFSFCVGAEPANSYVSGPTDKDLKTLVGRWAQLENKRIVWQAEGNAEIKDQELLNDTVKLGSAKSFQQAFDRLNKGLEDAYAQNPSKPPPLQACVFDDAIVIREFDQPGCGKQL